MFRITTWRARHEPVLGTTLDLRLQGRSRHRLQAAERLIVAELDRLEDVFSIFRPKSELSRWRADPSPHAQPSAEVLRLLQLAEEWQVRSSGAFNPAAGEAVELWKHAELTGNVPRSDRLAEAAAAIAIPRYRLTAGQHGDRVEKIGDCRTLTFHAIAKGLIIDLALQKLLATTQLASVMINIGGDLVHSGEGFVVVGIEGSASTADNATPVDTVRLSNAAMATSSGTRRGFRVGDTWFGHVIDPRTAQPLPSAAAASVIAPNAATADVLATILGVLQPPDLAQVGAALADHANAAARITFPNGEVTYLGDFAERVGPRVGATGSTAALTERQPGQNGKHH